MKKLFAAITSLLMAFTFVLPVSAEGGNEANQGYSITLKNVQDGHQYAAYQVFSGDYAVVNGTSYLSNIEWSSVINDAGKNVLKETAFPDLKGTAELNGKTAADVAKAMEALKDGVPFAKKLQKIHFAENSGINAAAPVNGTAVISGLQPGYYVVFDSFTNPANEQSTTLSLNMLQMTDNAQVEVKADNVYVEKKVLNNGERSDAAIHGKGDIITFKLIGHVPANLNLFDLYHYEFTDTLSKGLTLIPGSIRVKAIRQKARDEAEEVDVTNSFDVLEYNGLLETKFKVKGDLKKLKDAFDRIFNIDNTWVIEVTYKAVLNDDAVAGTAGNPNKVTLTYSNNPNDHGEGEGASTTVEDVVTVFTMNLEGAKIDGETKAPLAGAEFTLEKKVNGAWTTVGTSVSAMNGENAVFGWKSLGEGSYRISETKTPAGYNTIQPIEFTVKAEYDKTETNGVINLNNILINEKETDETISVNVNTGTLSTTIENFKGTVLPGTGGMGTTLFYAAGGLLMAGTVIVMIARRRQTQE